MSRLGRFNFYFAQWMLVRLAKVIDNDRPVGWVLIGPVLPMTGWRSPYVGCPRPLTKPWGTR